MDQKPSVAANQPVQAPSPATTPDVTTPKAIGTEVVQPAASSAVEDRSAQAFIKLRLARKADKQRIADLETLVAKASPAPQAPAAAPIAAPAAVVPVTTDAPTHTPVQPAVIQAAVSNDDQEAAAIKAIAVDPDVVSIPGGLIEVMDLVDSNPKLQQLNAIDPQIAYDAARKMFLEQHGISKTPMAPALVPVSGGITGGRADLRAIEAELDKAVPGSKRFGELVDQLNAAIGVVRQPR